MSSNRIAAASVPAPEVSSGPWWRFPIVWLVVSGPVLVVLASLVTVYLAVTRADPVLDISQIDPKTGQAPAATARNHSAEAATLPADR